MRGKNMTLQQLRYFCTIARELNFHKAAEIHHIAQPSLSTSIAKLEDELGFFLFERKGRHVELTKYGRYYSEQVAPILEQLEFITRKTQTLARSQTGLMKRQELVAIVPVNHELAGRGSVTLSELVQYPYVDYADYVGLKPTIHRILDDAGVTPKIAAKAPDEESIAGLVSEGFGVSFVASVYSLKDFDVAILKVERPDCFRTIYMTHMKDYYLTPAVMRFIRYGIEAELKKIRALQH